MSAIKSDVGTQSSIKPNVRVLDRPGPPSTVPSSPSDKSELPQADSLHTRRFELGDAERLPLDTSHELTGLDTAAHTARTTARVRQAWREEHVRARPLEGLEAADRVLRAQVAAQEVLERAVSTNRNASPAGGYHGGAATRRLPGRSSYSGRAAIPCRVLDGAARRARLPRPGAPSRPPPPANRRTLLEVAGDRQVRCLHDGLRVRQCLRPRHPPVAPPPGSRPKRRSRSPAPRSRAPPGCARSRRPTGSG